MIAVRKPDERASSSALSGSTGRVVSAAAVVTAEVADASVLPEVCTVCEPSGVCVPPTGVTVTPSAASSSRSPAKPVPRISSAAAS